MARPVTDLERSAMLYRRGLGFEELGRFADHAGFDGIIVGAPGMDYHLEFTVCRAHPVRPTPSVEDLLVFYVPHQADWESACARMLEAGFEVVEPFNPYWQARGRTFRDHDAYHVVLEQSEWSDHPRSTQIERDAGGRAVAGGYRIVAAAPEHLAALPAIELAAAALLVAHAPSSALEETTPDEVFREAQRERRLWVALADGVPIGFAQAAMLGEGHSHLEEIDVVPEHGRRGVGAALVTTVLEWARHSGHAETTLTTFRALPWNMPFYRQLGFEELGSAEWPSELRRIVAAEDAKGLSQERRCVMRYAHRSPLRAAVRQDR